MAIFSGFFSRASFKTPCRLPRAPENQGKKRENGSFSAVENVFQGKLRDVNMLPVSIKNGCVSKHTVDGRNPAPGEFGSLSHYLHGFLHPRW